MKVVTIATIKDFGRRCLGADVVVAGAFSEILRFWRVKYQATQFLTCQKCCYNCYNLLFYFNKSKDSKGLHGCNKLYPVALVCHKL